MEATASLDPSDDNTFPTFSDSVGFQAQPFVRLRADAMSAMSDAELQSYIHGCAEQFLAAQRRWEATGCFAAIGDRDAFWLAEADALVELGNRGGFKARANQRAADAE